MLTSREAPAELTIAAAQTARSLLLGGLGAEDVRSLLRAKQLVGTSEQWAELTARIGGDALALKVVGETIRELFSGDLGSFLEEHAGGQVWMWQARPDAAAGGPSPRWPRLGRGRIDRGELAGQRRRGWDGTSVGHQFWRTSRDTEPPRW
jgi:hypothetical protein